MDFDNPKSTVIPPSPMNGLVFWCVFELRLWLYMLWNTENIRFRYQIQNTKYKIWHTKIKIKSAKYILSSLTTCTTGNAHPPKVPSLQDVENADHSRVLSAQSCGSRWTQLQFPMFFPKKRFSPCVDENSPLYNASQVPNIYLRAVRAKFNLTNDGQILLILVNMDPIR